VAILAGELGFSVALGAFLIGAVVAETREARRIHEQIEPVRDMFSAMFFVAVGLSIELSAFLEHWRVVLLLSVVSVAGKIVTCAFGTLVAGYSPRAALRVGMALAPIGEFSFVIANLGRSAGVLSDFLYPVTVAVSALTILATPYLMRSADRVADALESWTPRRMRDFLAFYDRKVGGFARRRLGWRLPEETRWPIVRLAIAGTLVLALLQLTRSLVAAARRRGELFGAFADYRDVLVWSAAGVLALPLSIAMWRSTGELAEALLRRLSGRVESSRVIVEAFRFTLTVIAALVFLAIASPFFPTGIPLLVTGGLVGLSAFVFWRSLVAVQEDAERTIAAIFSASEGESAGPAQARSELTHLISQKYSFEVVLEDFILPFSKTAANCTIRDLALRSRFGVTIAAIYREEKAVVSPDPDTRLEPGDVLLLLGSREQIAAGMQHLEHLAVQPPP
jgi:CPA2 family monovalent cation:H+ antiporter-2